MASTPEYLSARVKRHVRLAEGNRRLVLHEWSVSDEPRLENLALLDEQGVVHWRAPLPAGTAWDCFVRLELQAGRIVATTWSGAETWFSPVTGAVIPRIMRRAA